MQRTSAEKRDVSAKVSEQRGHREIGEGKFVRTKEQPLQEFYYLGAGGGRYVRKTNKETMNLTQEEEVMVGKGGPRGRSQIADSKVLAGRRVE